MNLSRKPVLADGATSIPDDSFSILTYNILADCHVHGHEQTCYPFATPETLLKTLGPTSTRHLLTVKELNHFDCDVVLLQEVETGYSEILEASLREAGYDYKFMSKCGVAEGSALCWKTSRFECVELVECLIHDEFVAVCGDVAQDVVEELKRPNVALIGVLRDVRSGNYVICAGTHIIYNCFARPALQALQACLVARRVHTLREHVLQKYACNNVGVVFAGDFNGEPDHMSVQLMKNGTLTDEQMKTLESLSYAVKGKKAVPVTSKQTSLVTKHFAKFLANPLMLTSAYQQVMGVEPSVTSAEAEYVGCLDYMFYTGDCLKVVAVTEVDSSVAKVYSNGGPTELFASDHLPLVSVFAFC